MMYKRVQKCPKRSNKAPKVQKTISKNVLFGQKLKPEKYGLWGRPPPPLWKKSILWVFFFCEGFPYEALRPWSKPPLGFKLQISLNLHFMPIDRLSFVSHTQSEVMGLGMRRIYIDTIKGFPILLYISTIHPATPDWPLAPIYPRIRYKLMCSH